MKTIGLLGGMSWESTAEYYRILNQEAARRCGGLSSARIVLHSVDFAEVEALLSAGEWGAIAAHLGWLGRGLRRAGADFLLICTNTMHKVADEISMAAELPVLHIGDATAEAVLRAGLRKVGLLGTRPTMEQDFMTGRLAAHGIEVLVPGAKDRDMVHKTIFEELCRGQFLEKTRANYLRVMQQMAEAGAEGIVLGCAEIPLLVRSEDAPLPLFDTTRIHALVAVEMALDPTCEAD
ncbi:MAG: aspartate/glutamate racemase family protein [Desulfovibrionaceae bacterium]